MKDNPYASDITDAADTCQTDAWNRSYRSQPRQWKGTLRLTLPLPFGNGDKVLDIGCGNGKSSVALIEAGCDVTGIDISEEAVRICVNEYGGRMKALTAYVSGMPMQSGSADGIAMIHVLEHLDDTEINDGLKESLRILRPRGKIFVRVFHKEDMRSSKGKVSDDTVIRGNGIRYRYFTEEELESAFAAFRKRDMKRIDERTKFRETRSVIEAVFEKACSESMCSEKMSSEKTSPEKACSENICSERMCSERTDNL